MTQNVTHGQTAKRFTDRFIDTRKPGPTRIEIPEARTKAIFISDPDGTLIELVQQPGD